MSTSLETIREQYRKDPETPTCPHCGHDLTIETTTSFRTEACENQQCGKHWNIRPTGQCCTTPSFHAVKMVIAGGDIQVKEQCRTCGHTKNNAVGGYSKVERERLPEIDFSAREKSRSAFSEFEYHFRKSKEDFQFKAGQPEWKRKYDEYLQSNEWKEKRLLVLKRDKYLCQADLTNPATQVHHKTYRGVDFTGREPSFELVSLCAVCHAKIHNR